MKGHPVDVEIKQLVLAIKTIAEEKNLPEDVVQDVIEQALAAAWRRDFGDRDQEVRAELNTTSGDVTIYASMDVVERVGDDQVEISLEDAKKIKKDVEINDVIELQHKPTTFGRVAAQTARQVIIQKLREAEREVVLGLFEDKIGTIINATVQRAEARIVRIDLGKASGIMPMSEQIPGERYYPGSRIKVYLKDVERGTRGPQLILSRAAAELVKLLFQNEVPEMESGAVEIKEIAREAGVRTKIAVISNVQGVDPVGTFVGGHGTRVQAVMSEIGEQEKIDIIIYDEDTATFIKNALSPTEVTKVDLDVEAKKAIVRVPEDQLSIAIGKNGQNVRLASKLTGYEIDIASSGAPTVAEPTLTDEASSEEVVPTPKVETPMQDRPQKPRLKRKEDLESSLLDAISEHGQDVEETPATDAPKE